MPSRTAATATANFRHRRYPGHLQQAIGAWGTALLNLRRRGYHRAGPSGCDQARASRGGKRHHWRGGNQRHEAKLSSPGELEVGSSKSLSWRAASRNSDLLPRHTARLLRFCRGARAAPDCRKGTRGGIVGDLRVVEGSGLQTLPQSRMVQDQYRYHHDQMPEQRFQKPPPGHMRGDKYVFPEVAVMGCNRLRRARAEENEQIPNESAVARLRFQEQLQSRFRFGLGLEFRRQEPGAFSLDENSKRSGGVELSLQYS